MLSKHSGLILCIALMVAVSIVLGGETVKVVCTRTETSPPVNCVKQTSLYWTIPLAEDQLRGVRGAFVRESRDEEGDAYHTVRLMTEQGDVGLVFVSYPFLNAVDAARKINTFVQVPEETNFEYSSPGPMLSGQVPMTLIVAIPFFGVCIGIYYLLTRNSEKAKTAAG